MNQGRAAWVFNAEEQAIHGCYRGARESLKPASQLILLRPPLPEVKNRSNKPASSSICRRCGPIADKPPESGRNLFCKIAAGVGALWCDAGAVGKADESCVDGRGLKDVQRFGGELLGPMDPPRAPKNESFNELGPRLGLSHRMQYGHPHCTGASHLPQWARTSRSHTAASGRP